jgi:hypothetical protein
MKEASDALLQKALDLYESDKKNGGGNENAKVMQCLEGVERYYKSRKEANEALGKARFRLALAQKNSMHKLSIDDMREEITPTFRIDCEGGDGNGNASIDVDSLSLLSGLPSTEMRVAQKEFKKTLSLLVKSAQAANGISA